MRNKENGTYPHGKGKQFSDSKIHQMVQLRDKDFKINIINILNKVKQKPFQCLKNLSKGIRSFRRNNTVRKPNGVCYPE